jgi:hypothetical protein
MGDELITWFCKILCELRKWKIQKSAATIMLLGMVLTFLTIWLTITELCKLFKPLVEKGVELVSLVLHHHLVELLLLSILYIALRATSNL